jgi:hypothetical protein
MIEFDPAHKTFKISIPISNLREAGRYHQSLVNLLERIEIDENIPSLIKDLDCIYELMSHLLPDNTFKNNYTDLTDGT